MTTTNAFTVTLTGLPAAPIKAGASFTAHVHVTALQTGRDIPLTGTATSGVTITCPETCTLHQVGPADAFLAVTVTVPKTTPAGTVTLTETAGDGPGAPTASGTFTVAGPTASLSPEPTVTRTFTLTVPAPAKPVAVPRASAAPAAAVAVPRTAETAKATPSPTARPFVLPSVAVAPARPVRAESAAAHTRDGGIGAAVVVATLLIVAVVSGLLAIRARRVRNREA